MILSFAVLFKISFRIDKMAYWLIFANLASLIIKGIYYLISMEQHPLRDNDLLLLSLADSLSTFSICIVYWVYFYEILIVFVTLTSDSLAQYENRRKISWILMILYFSL